MYLGDRLQVAEHVVRSHMDASVVRFYCEACTLPLRSNNQALRHLHTKHGITCLVDAPESFRRTGENFQVTAEHVTTESEATSLEIYAARARGLGTKVEQTAQDSKVEMVAVTTLSI